MSPKKPWTDITKINTFRLFLLVYWIYGVGLYGLVVHFAPFPLEAGNIFALQALVVPAGMILGIILNVVLHEFSHAVAGTLLGQVFYIQIGRGHYVTTLRIFGIKWIFKACPDCGFVSWGITTLKWAKMRHFGVIFAGPLCTLIISLSLWQIVVNIPKPFWSSMPFACLPFFFSGVLGATCLALGGSWIPGRHKIDGRRVSSDMLQILNLGRLTQSVLEARLTFAPDIAYLSERNIKWPMTIESAKRAALQHPEDSIILYWVAQAFRDTEDTQYLSYISKALLTPSHSKKHRIRLLDEYLTGCLEHACILVDSNAHKWSLELLELHDDKITAKGTHGGVLIDLGKLEEGEMLLHEVLRETKSAIDKGYSNIFLALAQKQRGNLDAAREYAKKAAKEFPECEALKRVSDLLEPEVA